LQPFPKPLRCAFDLSFHLIPFRFLHFAHAQADEGGFLACDAIATVCRARFMKAAPTLLLAAALAAAAPRGALAHEDDMEGLRRLQIAITVFAAALGAILFFCTCVRVLFASPVARCPFAAGGNCDPHS
jgi:hypothetical protein